MAKALDINPYTLYDTTGRDTSVYYHDNDSWSAYAPVYMWFDYGVLNDFLKEWVVRMDELKSGEIPRDELSKNQNAYEIIPYSRIIL